MSVDGYHVSFIVGGVALLGSGLIILVIGLTECRRTSHTIPVAGAHASDLNNIEQNFPNKMDRSDANGVGLMN